MRESVRAMITQSITVKDTEFVLGERQSSGMYVMWVCKNGTDYYWEKMRGEKNGLEYFQDGTGGKDVRLF